MNRISSYQFSTEHKTLLNYWGVYTFHGNELSYALLKIDINPAGINLTAGAMTNKINESIQGVRFTLIS